jgi:hypothetical protein
MNSGIGIGPSGEHIGVGVLDLVDFMPFNNLPDDGMILSEGL